MACARTCFLVHKHLYIIIGSLWLPWLDRSTLYILPPTHCFAGGMLADDCGGGDTVASVLAFGPPPSPSEPSPGLSPLLVVRCENNVYSNTHSSMHLHRQSIVGKALKELTHRRRAQSRPEGSKRQSQCTRTRKEETPPHTHTCTLHVGTESSAPHGVKLEIAREPATAQGRLVEESCVCFWSSATRYPPYGRPRMLT